MKAPPTDFELLRAIYERYHAAWVNFTEEQERHADAIADEQGHDASTVRWHHRNAVPIDLDAIAGDLGVDANAVHGRLYHHLDPLYGATLGKDGKRTGFFIAQPGTTPDLVHFPLLEAVLAGLWQQRRRDLLAIRVAFASIGIAAGSLVVSIIAAT